MADAMRSRHDEFAKAREEFQKLKLPDHIINMLIGYTSTPARSEPARKGRFIMLRHALIEYMKTKFQEPRSVEKAKEFLVTLSETYGRAMRSRREITNKIELSRAIPSELDKMQKDPRIWDQFKPSNLIEIQATSTSSIINRAVAAAAPAPQKPQQDLQKQCTTAHLIPRWL